MWLITVKVKVKFILEEATMAQKCSRYVDLLFLQNRLQM